MACVDHCLGAAIATVSRMPQFAPCVSAQRCPGVVTSGQLVFLLQQAVSLPVGFGRKGDASVGNMWKSRVGGNVFASRRRALRQMIVMASPEAGTSTVVVQEVEFIWKGPGSKVLLSGDFVNWESQLPLEKTGSDGWFFVKQKLAPGTYKYKYIVDGEWQHSPDYPTVSDNAGGLNNEVTVAAAEDKPSPQVTSKESNAGSSQAEAAVKPPAEANEAAPKPKSNAAANNPKPKPAAAGRAKNAAKAAVKPLLETMVDDVVPRLVAYFETEKGVSDVEIQFSDNQLQGSFIKNQVPYNFWAYFPDGKLEGSRGFSLSSHGAPPSTVEPFLIDENKITGESVMQQVIKRLFAQQLLSTN